MKKQFLKLANKILSEYDCTPTTYLSYTMKRQTEYGLLYIRIDEETMKGKLYSIYMIFADEGFKKEEFMKAFLTDAFNPHSYKWNIHTRDMQTALNQLENRLEGLTYPITN
jgi:hypothetical protein